jgi:hypothetical protein
MEPTNKTNKVQIPGPVAELDLSGKQPVVLIDGEVLSGVVMAEVICEAGALPLLRVDLYRFEVRGGSLPSVATDLKHGEADHVRD